MPLPQPRRAVGWHGVVLWRRTPESLPCFGPLKKVPAEVLEQHLVYSRIGETRECMQDRMLVEEERVAELLTDPRTHIYVCGLRGMEAGVASAFTSIAESIGESWRALRGVLRGEGRYQVETY